MDWKSTFISVFLTVISVTSSLAGRYESVRVTSSNNGKRGHLVVVECRIQQLPWYPVKVSWILDPFDRSKKETIIPEDVNSLSTRIPKYVQHEFNDTDTQQTYKLVINDLEFRDEGYYECYVTTAKGTFHNKTALYVQGAPYQTFRLPFVNGMLGSVVTLDIRIRARPQVDTIEWFGPDGNLLRNGIKYETKDMSNENELFMYAVLDIKDFSLDDAGNYTVISNNSIGSTSSEIPVLADPYLEIVTPNLTNIRFPLRSTALYICRAINFQDKPKLIWKLKNSNIDIKTSEKVSMSLTAKPGSQLVWESQIVLRDLSYEFIGELSCSTRDPVYSATQLLDVVGIPRIDWGQSTVRASLGDTVTLSCNITSNPPLTKISWFRDSSMLRYMEYTTDTVSGMSFMETSYDVEVTSEKMYGTYKCEAENQLGKIGHGINLAAPYSTNQCPYIPCEEMKTCVDGMCFCPKLLMEDKNGMCVDVYHDNSPIELYLWIGVGGGGVLVLGLTVAIVFYVCWRRRSAKIDRKKSEELARTNAVYTHTQYAKPNIYEIITKPRDEFPRERLRFIHPVGVGKFGRVMKAEALSINKTGKWEEVAVKMCQESATDLDKEDLYNELMIIRKIPKHINVVSFFGACTYGEPLLLILEFVPKGDLRDYLRRQRPDYDKIWDSPVSDGSPIRAETEMTSNDEGEISAKDLLSYALQAAQGMKHLQACNIVHRDVAARNVLVGYNCVCKISDFGLARNVEGVDVYERTSTGPLPIRWMGPESLMEGTHSHKADVWSFGILLWEIVTLGASPYSAMTLREVIDAVVAGKRLERPQHCMNELYSLMCNCWEHFPKDRPTFGDLVHRLEYLLEKEADYIQLDQFQEAVYMVLEPTSMDERL